MAIGTLAAAGLAGLGSALGGFFGRPEQQPSGFDVFTPETFPGFENLQGTNIAFLQEELDRIRKGEIPQFLQGPAETLRGGQQQLLQEQFFGKPGRRSESLVNRAIELGSIAGVGPKGAQAQGGKAIQDFQSASQSIDNFINQLVLQGSVQSTLGTAGLAQAQPTGVPQTVIPFGGQAFQAGGQQQGFSQLGQTLGQAFGGAFGGGQQQPQFQPGQQFAGGGTGITGGPGSAQQFAQQMAVPDTFGLFNRR